jgi:hypothetical protein
MVKELAFFPLVDALKKDPACYQTEYNTAPKQSALRGQMGKSLICFEPTATRT